MVIVNINFLLEKEYDSSIIFLLLFDTALYFSVFCIFFIFLDGKRKGLTTDDNNKGTTTRKVMGEGGGGDFCLTLILHECPSCGV